MTCVGPAGFSTRTPASGWLRAWAPQRLPDAGDKVDHRTDRARHIYTSLSPSLEGGSLQNFAVQGEAQPLDVREARLGVGRQALEARLQLAGECCELALGL